MTRKTDEFLLSRIGVGLKDSRRTFELSCITDLDHSIIIRNWNYVRSSVAQTWFWKRCAYRHFLVKSAWQTKRSSSHIHVFSSIMQPILSRIINGFTHIPRPVLTRKGDSVPRGCVDVNNINFGWLLGNVRNLIVKIDRFKIWTKSRPQFIRMLGFRPCTAEGTHSHLPPE